MEDPKMPKKIPQIPQTIPQIPQKPKLNRDFQATILDLLPNLDQSQILNKEYQ